MNGTDGDTLVDRLGHGPTPEEVGRAAALCFLAQEGEEVIARRLGIARRTLARWKHRPDYAAASAALRVYFDVEMERERERRLMRYR